METRHGQLFLQFKPLVKLVNMMRYRAMCNSVSVGTGGFTKDTMSEVSEATQRTCFCQGNIMNL